jgi:hypothetical protein
MLFVVISHGLYPLEQTTEGGPVIALPPLQGFISLQSISLREVW